MPNPGTVPPESCIFGQLLNLGALLLCSIFYTRYKQVLRCSMLMETSLSFLVAEFCNNHPRKLGLKKLNASSIWFGVLGALGVR